MRCKGKKNGCINLRPTSTAARPNLYNVREREREQRMGKVREKEREKSRSDDKFKYAKVRTSRSPLKDRSKKVSVPKVKDDGRLRLT